MVDVDQDQLTPKQLRAVEALIAYGEVSLAAEAVGVNRATIRRWRERPAFVAALRAAEAEAIGDLSRRLARLSATAIDVVADLLDDDTLSPAIRLRAADLALARMLQLRDLVDVEERLAALESAVAGVA
jgi:hypothetical protein